MYIYIFFLDLTSIKMKIINLLITYAPLIATQRINSSLLPFALLNASINNTFTSDSLVHHEGSRNTNTGHEMSIPCSAERE